MRLISFRVEEQFHVIVVIGEFEFNVIDPVASVK